MSRLLLGVICGLVFGAIDVLLMIPIPFPPEKDKTLAMTGAFVTCVVIGIVIGFVKSSLPGWAMGTVYALLITLPTAIITKSYFPILVVSSIGGGIIGFIVHRRGT
jgi:hypothetical protein